MSYNSGDLHAACGSDLISFDSPAVKGMIAHNLIAPDFKVMVRFNSYQEEESECQEDPHGSVILINRLKINCAQGECLTKQQYPLATNVG